MVEANVTNLRADIEKMNSLINEIDEIKINLFNQLKNSCINWQDGNSLDFNDKVYLDHKEADLIITTLKEKREIYDFICSRYSAFGHKVKCDLDNKAKLLEAIQKCIDNISSIANKLGNIKVIDLSEAISSCNDAKDDLLELSEADNEAFNRILEFEKEIGTHISKLQEVKINEFDFDIDVNVR